MGKCTHNSHARIHKHTLARTHDYRYSPNKNESVAKMHAAKNVYKSVEVAIKTRAQREHNDERA